MIEIPSGNNNKIKAWTDYVPIEGSALAQLHNTASLNIVPNHLAVMPDVHYGMRATIGSVIPTKEAIIPAAVGVDIGCGMCAIRTSITANDLPESLKEIRKDLEATIPVGFDSYKDVSLPRRSTTLWQERFEKRFKVLEEKYTKIMTKQHPVFQLGTLGGGNHFIEICLDTEDTVWVMLHSGSRGIGNRIGQFFISKAKKEMEELGISLTDKNLSYLREGTNSFDDYTFAVEWAQDYASINRLVMLERVVEVLEKHFFDLKVSKKAVNCHHNYVQKETHFNQDLWITRKGAVSARKDELGIIPGSMGAKSFIVKGLGNPESYHSCSHGAGRVMSRTEAKRQISIDDHLKDTDGVECRKDKAVLDESPRAYKNIDDVMKSQEDLVEIVATLKQIVCVKG